MSQSMVHQASSDDFTGSEVSTTSTLAPLDEQAAHSIQVSAMQQAASSLSSSLRRVVELSAQSSMPFARAQLDFDPDRFTSIQFRSSSKLHHLLQEFVVRNIMPEDATRFVGHTNWSSTGVRMALGLGLFRFHWREETLRCLHERSAGPLSIDVGTPSEESILYLFAERQDDRDARQLLEDLCVEVLREDGKPVEAGNETEKELKIWRYDSRHEYWSHEKTVRGRPLASVILPQATIDRLINDLNEFLSPDTQEFYQQHGIPLKRSYLLWGVPGSGKTSLIQAVASKYGRRLCYLAPSDSGMDDNVLKSAVAEVPENAVIVIEDIDAMFSRRNHAAMTASNEDWGVGSSLVNAFTSSRVTLSGLLNALDGIGTANGQIVFLTTNFREHLDAALVRKGRVDLHIEFRNATHEQMKKMFASFYPKAEDLSEAFAQKLHEDLDGMEVSTASLQHFFIQMRRKTAEEAVASVAEVRKELCMQDTSGEEESDSGGWLLSVWRWVRQPVASCSHISKGIPVGL